MDRRLLDIICCPLTKLPLELLDGEKLAELNSAIASGTVRNRGGQDLTEPLQQALITRDRRLVYPVRDTIPILLEEESIDWTPIS